jgi:hypothetical protein
MVRVTETTPHHQSSVIGTRGYARSHEPGDASKPFEFKLAR